MRARARSAGRWLASHWHIVIVGALVVACGVLVVLLVAESWRTGL